MIWLNFMPSPFQSEVFLDKHSELNERPVKLHSLASTTCNQIMQDHMALLACENKMSDARSLSCLPLLPLGYPFVASSSARMVVYRSLFRL